jgi:signal transduction histidine kinase
MATKRLAEPPSNVDEFDKIPLRMHPRVFAALGADLVTNDVVAVIELVKNCYDAFASNAWIRFLHDETKGDFLEIEDDGTGMTRKVIEDVWCLVATPFKKENPLIENGNKSRRVAGEKGLGRLSVARLGERLEMLTQGSDSTCWELTVVWEDLTKVDNIAESFVLCREYPAKSPFDQSGTMLRIFGLKGQWDKNTITDLQDNLGRLISPFFPKNDFNIFLSSPFTEESGVSIESPDFLSEPKYCLSGNIDDEAQLTCNYEFKPISEGKARQRSFSYTWEQVYERITDKANYTLNETKNDCGPFSFEIRAWDIGSEDTQEISDRFDYKKNKIRKAIRAHKGISVYRDGILILPKSEDARDWLGLDLRRVSKTGTRMSTSQLVGYVSITSEKNPCIRDTSSREGLMNNREVSEFEAILHYIVAVLENEREQDRAKAEIEKPIEDLFNGLSADKLMDDIDSLAEEGVEALEAVPLVRAFSTSLDKARRALQERFVYYSQLATIGTISQLVVHEIRIRTTAFGSFLDFIKDRFGPFNNDELQHQYQFARRAVDGLERLADTFSPLAGRSFRRRRRHSILEERIKDCLELQRGDIKKKNIQVLVPESETHVAVDPGELDAILLNLITNAVYWLSKVPKEERRLFFRIERIKNSPRVRVWVHDTGPGIDDELIDKVFWPGVTRRPDGLGMGLTVASELVAEYSGQMLAKTPGEKGGASFSFDLPLKS